MNNNGNTNYNNASNSNGVRPDSSINQRRRRCYPFRKVSIDATEQAKLIATNIREGVTILGVEGAMSGSEDMKPQSKEVTPSKEAQTIMPDEEYNCLSQVTVKAIPYVETDNSAGGKTVTIG